MTIVETLLALALMDQHSMTMIMSVSRNFRGERCKTPLCDDHISRDGCPIVYEHDHMCVLCLNVNQLHSMQEE